MAQILLLPIYQDYLGPHITTIPVEIFIEICSHLHPSDLFSLIGACKQFRHWLNSITSPDTQGIWRTSRLKFLPYLQLKPFADMNEQSYIRLGLLEKGCQFCRRRDDLDSFFPSHRELPSDSIPLSYIPNCLPYIQEGPECGSLRMYWRRDVRAICKELKPLTREERTEWLSKKISKTRKIMEDSQKRQYEEDNWLMSRRREDKKEFERIINELSEKRRDDGEPKYISQSIWNLKSCAKALELSREPCVRKDWEELMHAMMMEYEESMKHQRRQQICAFILSLLVTDEPTLDDTVNATGVTESEILDHRILISESLLECLRWCPSYQDPPFIDNDPRNPWSNQYLLHELIPRLRKEANELHKLPGPMRPGENTIYNYQGVRCHLYMNHGVSKVMEEEMVFVDRNKVVECLSLIFPFDVDVKLTLEKYHASVSSTIVK
ncbi:11366_t:CDS:2 [Acaulospora colombiana]|uniref:11366_t:CDS:1 n=1 Tax=Acaulospora colombiana TaxID=27376 RepID=A0ACA9LK22_9GLOM|nr:11366_t:CDS:2 [Acaulospora colombiana]